MRKTWAIERAGFDVNPRTVLAMGFFDAFRERCGLNAALTRELLLKNSKKIVGGQFEEAEMKVLRRLVKQIHKDFRGIPLAVKIISTW